jgi:hypothetical protein
MGQGLRFIQEYFLVACSLADLVRRFRSSNAARVVRRFDVMSDCPSRTGARASGSLSGGRLLLSQLDFEVRPRCHPKEHAAQSRQVKLEKTIKALLLTSQRRGLAHIPD